MSCCAEAPYALVANDSPLSVADDTSDDNADDRHTSQHLQLHRRARVSVLSIFDLVYSVVPGECIGSRNAEWPRGDRLGSVSGWRLMSSRCRGTVLFAGSSAVFGWGNDASASGGSHCPAGQPMM